MISYGDYTDPPVGGINCYEGVDLQIGNFSSLASGLTIISGEHPSVAHPKAVSQFPFYERFGTDYWKSKMDGQVTIGSDCWVCENVTIITDVTVGDGAILGACSVITKDVPPYAVMVGNPAFPTKYRFSREIIAKLLQIKWWNWPIELIKERSADFKDIQVFLYKYSLLIS